MNEKVVTFDKKTGTCEIKSGITVVPKGTILGNQKVKILIIPEGVEEIEGYAFSNLKKLQKVSLPSTLKTVGQQSFCSCGSAKIHLPDSLTQIGRAAFDFEDGRITMNASNVDLVKKVAESLQNQRYKTKRKDDVLTISDLHYIDEPEMTMEDAWEVLFKATAEKKHEEAGD